MSLYKITEFRVINLEAFTNWEFFPIGTSGRQARLNGWTGNEPEGEGSTLSLVSPDAEHAWKQLQAMCAFDMVTP